MYTRPSSPRVPASVLAARSLTREDGNAFDRSSALWLPYAILRRRRKCDGINEPCVGCAYLWPWFSNQSPQRIEASSLLETVAFARMRPVPTAEMMLSPPPAMGEGHRVLHKDLDIVPSRNAAQIAKVTSPGTLYRYAPASRRGPKRPRWPSCTAKIASANTLRSTRKRRAIPSQTHPIRRPLLFSPKAFPKNKAQCNAGDLFERLQAAPGRVGSGSRGVTSKRCSEGQLRQRGPARRVSAREKDPSPPHRVR